MERRRKRPPKELHDAAAPAPPRREPVRTAPLPPGIEITGEFRSALGRMEGSGGHLFITGNAGTGKSTLLQYFRATTAKEAVVLAPTGVAAINVGGATIHSFFRFPTRLVAPADIRAIRGKKELFARLQTLVIDEVSMVRADVMDAVDLSLRANRPRSGRLPFGGVQMILFGDLCQLPPVVEPGLAEFFRTAYASPYFFSAHAFDRLDIGRIELGRIFRQRDPEFVGILNAIRRSEITPAELARLNARCADDIPLDEEPLAVMLTGTNALAARINEARLNALEGREFTYEALCEGEFDETSSPAARLLRLRAGAQIMMVRNDPLKRWVNGSLGIVERCSGEEIEVSIGGGRWSVEPATWEKIAYEAAGGGIEPVVTGSFRQYPMRLAWAITVHKSQGQTFDSVVIDLGAGAFAPGQAYVALSRCRTLSGIRLRRPLRMSDIIVDERIARFNASGGFS